MAKKTTTKLSKRVRSKRFERLRRTAAKNAAGNNLTGAKAMALVELARQEQYEKQLERHVGENRAAKVKPNEKINVLL